MDSRLFGFADSLSADQLREIRQTAHSGSWFRIRHPLFPADRCAAAIATARAFFDLPANEKESLSIEYSPHFRGYSVMHNARDWREQIHFGAEESARECRVYERLRGPNQWSADADWRDAVLALMRDLEAAGREVLSALGRSLGLEESAFLQKDESPYVLLKMIHYQPVAGQTVRSGVAPHVDFSWITLLLQDDAGGLEVRAEDGGWIPIPPEPGTLLVNFGEILQFATGGYFRATPHRVIGGPKSRISIPFFLNPGLDTTIERIHLPADPPPGSAAEPEHVHRVFAVEPPSPFVFGDEEWKRKGLGIYCGSCLQP